MKENNTLKLIQYIPALFIILFSILITYFMTSIYKNNLLAQKEALQKEYILHEKDRVRNNIQTTSLYIENEKRNSYKALQRNLRTQVNNAYNIVNSIYNDSVGIRGKEKILKRVKTALQNIRFNSGRGYFFIYDREGFNIFHPTNKELEGTSYKNRKALGKYTIKSLVDITQIKKEGFVEWSFLKPSKQNKEYRKIGFIKKFEPYGWYIATGEYLDDFEKEVKEKLLNNLRVLKFKNDGYLYVLNREGTILANQKREMEGLNISTLYRVDQKDVDFFTFEESSLEGKFLEYKVAEDLDDTNKKIAYMKKLEAFNWIIGTGFNTSNINRFIQQREYELEKSYKENIAMIITTAGVVTTILLIVLYFLSSRLQKIFFSYRKELVKQEQEQMREQYQKLKNILDNLPIMIGYKDTKNNVLTVNKSSADFMGVDVERLSNVPMRAIFPNDYKRYYRYDQEVIRTKKPKLGFIEIQEVQGKQMVVEVSVVPVLDNKNEVKNLIVFMSDITEKVSLQEENHKKQQLLYQQNKLATMGEMIGNIAHQWRQPLSTISTASTGTKLKKEMDVLEDKEFFSSMDLINESVQYLSQTIEDFRNFFAPSKLNKEKFFISAPINKTIKLVNSSFISKEIEIVNDIEDLEINSLSNEIVQVLINLLNNAKDALLSKREEDRLVFIKTFVKDEFLQLEVKDNGFGIDEEIMQRVFEPYFTTKHKSQGTGIGLYMSYEIATKLLKGSLEVENETFTYKQKEYRGAKFILKIPLS